MSNNNPTPPPSRPNQRPNDPKPLNNGLAPISLRRVGRIQGVIRAPAAPKSRGGKRHTRRKHRKSRKTHRRRN